jgi:hypothetical protein
MSNTVRIFFLWSAQLKLKMIKYLQWSYGGLDIGMILALIEASKPQGDDQKMQTTLGALDTCSQRSLFSLREIGKLRPILGNSAGVDECNTAAQFMECGKNSSPEMFDNIFTAVDYTAVV